MDEYLGGILEVDYFCVLVYGVCYVNGVLVLS